MELRLRMVAGEVEVAAVGMPDLTEFETAIVQFFRGRNPQGDPA
jgi:hypothetical protein